MAGAVAAADLANNLRRLWLLPRWARQTEKRPRDLRWLLALVDLIVPICLFVGLPHLISAALHHQGG